MRKQIGKTDHAEVARIEDELRKLNREMDVEEQRTIDERRFGTAELPQMLAQSDRYYPEGSYHPVPEPDNNWQQRSLKQILQRMEDLDVYRSTIGDKDPMEAARVEGEIHQLNHQWDFEMEKATRTTRREGPFEAVDLTGVETNANDLDQYNLTDFVFGKAEAARPAMFAADHEGSVVEKEKRNRKI